jgi:hypothetical protein
MLFDLRSRGRRGTVRVVYIGLAILIGLGLVGFGIGGGFGGGGLFTAGTENEGSNRASFQAEVKKYRKQTQLQPTNPEPWEKLTLALLRESGGTEEVTAHTKELFNQASEAWERYLTLTHSPSPSLAKNVFSIYAEPGLNRPDKAVQALQIIVAAEPRSASFWGQLAIYAYKSKNVRQGDLAAAKAIALSPPAQRVATKERLAEVRKDPFNERTYTTTTNGKTYAVKKAANGTFTGTEIKPSTPPAATTTTKK